MGLQGVGAVLQRVLLFHPLPRQLPGLPHRHEAGPERARHRPAQDEPSGFDAHDVGHSAVGERLGHRRDHVVQQRRVREDRGDVLEDDPGLGVVLDRSECFPDPAFQGRRVCSSDVEAPLGDRLVHVVLPLHSLHLGVRRPGPEQLLQPGERVRRPATGDDLDPSVRQVPRVALQGRARGRAGPRTSGTRLPAPRPRPGTACVTPAGSSGRGASPPRWASPRCAMMARITRLKFSRTVGMLPKK